MKLIVTGATGFVGTEVVRQALAHPSITSVVALARKPVAVPPNTALSADLSKLRSVVLDDWTRPYPESVKEQVQGADGCIWTLAVTPSRSRTMPFADVTTICADFTTAGIAHMSAIASSPFRFVYTSGVLTERDQSKSLDGIAADYRLMRGRVENALLSFAAQHAPHIKVTVTKPGFIDGPGREAQRNAALSALQALSGSSPRLHVSELAAAMIDQCVNGITKDPLWSSDLEEIGRKLLQERDYLV